MKPIAILSIFCCLLGTTLIEAAQAQSGNKPDQTVKLNTELVVLDARVIRKKGGQFIGGLRKEDFDIYEDGKRQVITHFSQDNPPISVVLWMDLHSSANVFAIPQIRTYLPEILQHFRPQDEVAVMACFCDKIWLMHEFTKDKALLAQRMANGFSEALPSMTPLLSKVFALKHRTLTEAAKSLNAASAPDGRRAIIAITDDFPTPSRRDGCDENQVSPYRPGLSKNDTRPRDDVFRQLFTRGIIVSALVTPNPYSRKANRLLPILEKFGKIEGLFRGYNPWDFADAKYYASRTGGEIVVADPLRTPDQLAELIDHLYTRYSFGYVSSNQKKDGKFRKIKLRVSPFVEKRERDVVVVTRDGYYAPIGDSVKSRSMK